MIQNKVMIRLIGISALALSCSTPDKQTEPTEDCGKIDDNMVAVVSSLDFARREEDGTTQGFDLDGLDTVRVIWMAVDPRLDRSKWSKGIDSAFSDYSPL